MKLLPPLAQPLTLYSFRGRAPLDFGVLVGATGGNVELRVTRPDYEGPLEAWQVDPETSSPVQPLPAANMKGWEGLRRFFKHTITTRSGKPVAERLPAVLPQRERPDARLERRASRRAVHVRLPVVLTVHPRDGLGDRGGLGDARLRAGRLLHELPFRERSPHARQVPGEGRDHAVLPHVLRRPRRGRRDDRRLRRAAAAPERPGRADQGPHRGAARERPGPPRRPTTSRSIRIPTRACCPTSPRSPPGRSSTRNQRRRDYLSFASTAWNAGPAPMLVEGFRSGAAETMDAYQYFYDEDGDATSRAPVGTFEFDHRNGHHHWHFLQFTRYSILDATTNEVVRSTKQSFCLAPDRPDRPDRAARGLPPVPARDVEHLRRVGGALAARGAPGRLGRHRTTSRSRARPSTSRAFRTARTRSGSR